MHNLFRFYNQNRIKIWIIVIAIIFGFTIIQILNKSVEERKIAQSQEETLNNTINSESGKNYTKESESMVSGGTVNQSYQDDFGNLLDNFLTYCINEKYEEAYNLLSTDCKETLYKSESLFETLYCNNKFTKLKTYSFQSWSSAKGRYIYLVKIFDNMLATGKDNTQNYIQDYLTIVKENGEYKINIGGFIEKQAINQSTSKDGITIKITNAYIYMDYQIYDIELSNSTGETICLENMEDSNDVYLLDENETKFTSIINENIIDDFILESGYKKTIQIKFNASYRANLKMVEMVFSKIIENYQDNMNYSEFKEIVVEF